MKFSVYIERILRDKIKLAFIIFLFLIPLLDIGQILRDLYFAWGQGWEAEPPEPRYAAFSALYTVGTNHMLHKIMFWFLPIYLLIIVGEDSLEDQDVGYSIILKSRMSRKQYIVGKAKNSFLLSFLIVFMSLMLNYILLQLIFDQGGHIGQSIEGAPDDQIYVIGYYHPVAANLANILMTAILSGLIGLIGTALAMCLHDRKIVYGITFLLWFTFVLLDDGLMIILHPFSTLTIDKYIAAFLFMVIGYSAIAMTALIAEVRSDEV